MNGGDEILEILFVPLDLDHLRPAVCRGRSLVLDGGLRGDSLWFPGLGGGFGGNIGTDLLFHGVVVFILLAGSGRGRAQRTGGVVTDGIAESMPFGTGALVFIGIYLFALIGLGLLSKRASRENSMRDFYLGGKGVGFLILWLTLFATQYSGNTIVGFTGKSSQIGFAWLTSVQFMTMIVVAYLLFAPKLHRLAKKHHFITPTDFLTYRFQNRGLSLLATLIMVAALGNFFLAQLTAMGRAVEGLTPVDPSVSFLWGVVLLAGIMLIYETLGGFRAVAWTDVIQGGILVFGFSILLVLVFAKFGSPGETTRKLLETAPEMVTPPQGPALRHWINFILLLGFGAALYPQAIQRVYAAKSEKALRRGLAAMSFMPLFSTLTATLVGVTVAAHLGDKMVDGNQDTALSVMLFEIQQGSFFGYCLVVVIFAAILGAIMSTGDSALLSISSMLTKDIYASFIRPGASEASLTRLGKFISAALVVALAWLAIYLNGLGEKITLIQLLAMKFDMLIQLAPAFFIGIHWRGMRSGPVFAGIAVGLVFSLMFFWVPKEGTGILVWMKNSGFNPGIYGLLLNFLIAVPGSLLWNRRRTSEAESR